MNKSITGRLLVGSAEADACVRRAKQSPNAAGCLLYWSKISEMLWVEHLPFRLSYSGLPILK